ncbi:MAG: hypothetical protein KF716_04540 [Anaerolineae bacterium]|nr:hypothetical protein [Anaerolineae bacterium]
MLSKDKPSSPNPFSRKAKGRGSVVDAANRGAASPLSGSVRMRLAPTPSPLPWRGESGVGERVGSAMMGEGGTTAAAASPLSGLVSMSLTPTPSPLPWRGESGVGKGVGAARMGEGGTTAVVASQLSGSVRMSLTPAPSPLSWRGESGVGEGVGSARMGEGGTTLAVASVVAMGDGEAGGTTERGAATGALLQKSANSRGLKGGGR